MENGVMSLELFIEFMLEDVEGEEKEMVEDFINCLIGEVENGNE